MQQARFLSVAAAIIVLVRGLVSSAPHVGQAQVITGTPDNTMSPPNPNPVPTALVPTDAPGVLPDTPNTPNVTTATGVTEGSSGAPGTGAGAMHVRPRGRVDDPQPPASLLSGASRK